MVIERIFYGHSFIVFPVTAVFIQRGNKLVGIIFIIVYLRGFKPYSVYADFRAEFFHGFNLVLIGPHNKELENNKRRFAFQLFFYADDVFSAFYYFIELTPYPV